MKIEKFPKGWYCILFELREREGTQGFAKWYRCYNYQDYANFFKKPFPVFITRRWALMKPSLFPAMVAEEKDPRVIENYRRLVVYLNRAKGTPEN